MCEETERTEPGAGDAEQLRAAAVTPGFLRTLGTTPFIGRDFAAGGGSEADIGVALLTYSFRRTLGTRRSWRLSFAAMMRDAEGHLAYPWTIVRVFISSTFRDMQAERDHLVRFVFPRLRDTLLRNHIHLVDVDLRWGVKSGENVLDVCREIVDECRPRFLCVLGGRYGWVPGSISRSITADEIHYAVLDRPVSEQGIASFYFRDEAATSAIVEETPGDYREPPGSPGVAALAALKQAIVDAGLAPFVYPARWDRTSGRLTGLDVFGERVYSDLLASIRSDPDLRDRFEADATASVDEFAEDEAATDTFVEERSERFVLGSRAPLFDGILAHARASDAGACVCLVGAPGSGKSALMSKLARDLAQDAALPGDSALLIRHFAGATPGSTNVRHTLRRFCRALEAPEARGGPAAAGIPDDYEGLRLAFRDLLRRTCADRRVVILVDGADQFESVPDSRELQWLPEDVPPAARIVLSTTEGPALEALRGRRHAPREIALGPLTREDGEAIVERFLRRYRKDFEPDQRAALLAKREAGIPLYLLAALEELRTLGTYEEIGRRIDDLPPTTIGLFAWILERLEQDAGFRDADGRQVSRDLVRRFAALLSASRHGLSEGELAKALAPAPLRSQAHTRGLRADELDVAEGDAGRDDAQGNVAALVHLLRPYLMRRGELLDFHHGQFRHAAEARALPTPSARTHAHRNLASLFLRLSDPSGDRRWSGSGGRAFEELTHHLRAAGHRDTAARLLRHMRYLDARCALTDPLAVLDELADMAAAGDAEAATWRDFLRPRAGVLRRLPDTLPALAWHEGPPAVRASVEAYMRSGPARRSWLKLDAQPPIDVGSAPASGPSFDTVAACAGPEFRTTAAAIAASRGVAFHLERLGRVGLVDVTSGRRGSSTLEIPRRRLLAMAATDDGRWLAVVDEQGEGLMLEMAWSDDYPLEPTVVRTDTFRCLLPEAEGVAIGFAHGALWWQDENGRLQRRDLRDTNDRGSTAALELLPGELRGIAALGTGVVAWSVDSATTRVLAADSGGRGLRRMTLPREAMCGCVMEDQRLFLVCRDGSSAVLAGAELERLEAGPSLELRTVQVWPLCGGVLLVNFQMRVEFWPGTADLRLQAPTGLPHGYGPIRALASRKDDVLVVVMGGAFALRRGRRPPSRDDTYVWAVVPTGDGYHAVIDAAEGAYCASTAPPGSRLFTAKSLGPIEPAANQTAVVWISRCSPCSIWMPPAGNPAPLARAPGALQAVAAGPDGTFWFANELGEIYSLSPILGFIGHGGVPVNQPRRPALVVARQWLFWTGLGLDASHSGIDNLETLVVYRLHERRGVPSLDFVGQRTFDPADGLWTLTLWDETTGELACFFQQISAHSHIVRAGTPEDLLCGREKVIPLRVAETELWAALPIMSGRAWLVRSTKGTVLALSAHTFEQLAAYHGSLGCTALACSPGPGADAMLVEGHRHVVRCSLESIESARAHVEPSP